MDHSEVKHLPKVDHTPAELDEPSKLLLRAASLIETHGWCQYNVCDERGRMCVNGALLKAYTGSPDWPDDQSVASNSYPPAIASRRLAMAVGVLANHASVWNNEDARTKDEVISKLRAAALGHAD